jgi:glutaredoxin 1
VITVYGKEGCPYCTRAVNLLEQKEIPYQYFSVGETIGITEFKEMFPTVKTVPYIINNSNVIGGFSELQQYLEETASGFADSF